MDYGRRIRRARMARKLTQAQLALFVEVHRSAVSQWEHQKGTVPSISHMAKVAEVLEVSLEWLATGRGHMRMDPAYQLRERVPSEFARDETEERMLMAARQLNAHKREAVLALMEALAR